MPMMAARGTVLVSSLVSLAAGAFDLTVLHVNDHHSHLDGKGIDFDKDKFGFNEDVTVRYGGYPRLVTALNSLKTDAENSGRQVLKLHAGDAITGTSYYSLFDGAADAKMMLRACFDVFVLGNHEFDDGDQRLSDFIDMFKDGSGGVCSGGTQVVSANVSPGGSSPLDGKIAKSAKVTLDGQEIGIVGITIKRKTEKSSSPSPGTTLSDEVAAAQAEITTLTNDGVNKIILLTHIGLDSDKSWMADLAGVDAIIGGDSHSLLGDADTVKAGLSPSGEYAQELTNSDGKKVCVVQAWEYAKALGNLEISFDDSGDVQSCGGSLKFPYDANAMVFDDDDNTALTQTQKDTVTTWLDTLGGQWMSVVKDSQTDTDLDIYADQVDVLKGEVIVFVPEVLCLERVPGVGKSGLCSVDVSKANGGAACQVVVMGFLEVTKSADVALQNAGGCREDIPAGNFTHDDALQMLPFANTLVTFTLTGAQIKMALEDGVDFALQEDGAYPYAAGLRFAVDRTQEKGSRILCLEVNKRLDGSWAAISDAEEYTMVTNSYIASGKDGYTTLGTLPYTDTFTEYAQGLLRFTKEVDTLTKPPASVFSTQGFKNIDGEVYSTMTDCQFPDSDADAAVAAGVSAATTLVAFLFFGF